jgi:hypothetical protein
MSKLYEAARKIQYRAGNKSRQADSPFCTRSCAADIFGFFFAAASSFFLTDQSC